MTEHPKIQPSERSIWEEPRAILVMWVALVVGCVVAVVIGFVLSANHLLQEKPHFEGKPGFLGLLGAAADHFPAFYAVVGFLSFSFIVLVGQHLRLILMRPEDYYAKGPNQDTTDEAVSVGDMSIGEREG